MTLNEYLREQFGCKVYKIAINGGFTCPNRDGSIGTGGCIFAPKAEVESLQDHPTDQ